MATDNNLSVKVQSQLPSYLAEDGPNLVTFMKAYYEWLESEGKVNERAQNLLNYNDVDENLDQFIDYFNREILNLFPAEVLADRRLLMKNIRDLYQAKGSENAFRLLFRLLFDEEILFYFPGDDILRTSDGRWAQETLIRLSGPFDGDPSTLGGQTLTGSVSGATAQVVRVGSSTDSGITVFNCFVEKVQGIFQDGERVTNTSGTVSASIVGTIGPIQGITVSFGGSNNQLGDIVRITSSTGTVATGVVTQTTDSSLTFNIVDGGSGYTSNSIITVGDAPPGFGASFGISGLSNTEIISINTDTVGPAANIVLNTGPTFASGGANPATLSAEFGGANISSTLQSGFAFQNTVYGSISALSVVNGSGYTTLPAVTVVEPSTAELLIPDGAGGFKGRNAVIQAEFVPGSIETIQITDSGIGNFLRNEEVTIVNQTRAAVNSRGFPIVGGVNQLPGAYRDTKGFLSWNNRLQDGFFYQQYSYVIQSEQNVDAYRKFVDNTIHPAGHLLFGQKDIRANLDVDASVKSELIKYIFSTSSINVPTIVSANVGQYISDGSEGALDSLPSVSVELPVDEFVTVHAPTLEVGPGFKVEVQSTIQPLTANVAEAVISKVIADIQIPAVTTVQTGILNLPIQEVESQQILPFANEIIGTGAVTLPNIGLPTLIPIPEDRITGINVPQAAPTALVSDITIAQIEGQLIGAFANTVIGTGTVELPFVGTPNIQGALIYVELDYVANGYVEIIG